MMRQTNLILLSCALALTLMACGKSDNTASKEASTKETAANTGPAQTSTSDIVSSASVVRVEASGAETAADGSAEATVKLTIKDGYHVNANPPSMAYLIPTELSAETGEGVTAGKPVYPPSITKKFAFSETPLAVYEKEAVIKLPLKITDRAMKGERDLKVKLRVQACDDKACYKPGTLEAFIPLTIK